MRWEIYSLLLGYAATTLAVHNTAQQQFPVDYQQQSQQQIQADAYNRWVSQQNAAQAQQPSWQQSNQAELLKAEQAQYPAVGTINNVASPNGHTPRSVAFPTQPPNAYAYPESTAVQQPPGRTQQSPSSIFRDPQPQYSNPAPTATAQQQPAPVRPVAPNRPQSSGAVTYPGTSMVATQSNPHEKFSTHLFQVVAPSSPQTNVVYSPISLQTLLAMVDIGAAGQTAKELQTGLQLPANNNEVGQLFQSLLQQQQTQSGAQLIMANKMYYKKDLALAQNIKSYARTYFDAELEAIDFTSTGQAAQKINQWVAGKTHQRIRNLVSPYSLDAQTQAILVNAIYFKAKWAKEFSSVDTQAQNFYVTSQQTVPVSMMYNDDVFRYAEIDEIQAKVLELPYRDSDLSMLIILPNAIDGLFNVERILAQIDLRTLAERLKPESVTLRMPKFKIEFELDMLQPLQSLGIRRVFSSSAELPGIFPTAVQISKVQHKAFIDVNEAGSEAAAASFTKFIPLALPAKQIAFTVDHPFMFAIRSPQAVYFVGHVVRF